MTKLFIANCTQHDHTFAFRLVEVKGVKVQQIPSGGQIQIADDRLTNIQIEGILEQDGKYGLCSISEFERRGEFVPRIYSLDRQIPVDVIRRCMDLNTGVLTRRGEKARQLAAIAVNNAIENKLATGPTASTLSQLEMSVVEDKPGSIVGEGGPISAAAPIAEGNRVMRLVPGENSPPRSSRRGGRTRKAA